MNVDYNLIPDLHIGLNLSSQKVLAAVHEYEIHAPNNTLRANALTKFFKHTNYLLASDCEDMLLVLPDSTLLNLSPFVDPIHFHPFFKVELSPFGKYIIPMLHSSSVSNPPFPFPTLLVNGSMYIDDIASAIPPHNLADIAAAIHALIETPDIRDEDLIHIIKGPDFPSGGIVHIDEPLKKFYRTGRGRVSIYTKMEESTYQNSRAVRIKEFPYSMPESSGRIIHDNFCKKPFIDTIYDTHIERELGSLYKFELFVLPYRTASYEDICSHLSPLFTNTYSIIVTSYATVNFKCVLSVNF